MNLTNVSICMYLHFQKVDVIFSAVQFQICLLDDCICTYSTHTGTPTHHRERGEREKEQERGAREEGSNAGREGRGEGGKREGSGREGGREYVSNHMHTYMLCNNIIEPACQHVSMVYM